jgi:hypothetical protein
MSVRNVITPAVEAELETWKRAFVERWAMQPPEFFQFAGAGVEDIYSRDIGELVNPIHTPLYDQLLREATLADLDALEKALGPVGSGSYMGYLRFFQSELLAEAKKADEEDRLFSHDIPRWFRFKGWDLREKWNCEAAPACGGAGAGSGAAAPEAAAETLAEENARLKRDNEWLKRQVAAAEKALSLKHLPMPTEEQEDGEDPDHFSHAGLIAKYCAVMRENTEFIVGRTELVARLYLKEMAAGAHFTVSESEAADLVIKADKQIRHFRNQLTYEKAKVDAHEAAHVRNLERIDALEAQIRDLTYQLGNAKATSDAHKICHAQAAERADTLEERVAELEEQLRKATEGK